MTACLLVRTYFESIILEHERLLFLSRFVLFLQVSLSSKCQKKKRSKVKKSLLLDGTPSKFVRKTKRFNSRANWASSSTSARAREKRHPRPRKNDAFCLRRRRRRRRGEEEEEEEEEEVGVDGLGGGPAAVLGSLP